MDFWINRHLPPAERAIVYDRLFDEMGIGNKRKKDRELRARMIEYSTSDNSSTRMYEASWNLRNSPATKEMQAQLAESAAAGLYTPNKYPGYECNELEAWERQFPNWDVPGHHDNTNAYRVEMLTQLERACDLHTRRQWAPQPTHETTPAPAPAPAPAPKPQPQRPQWDVDGLEGLTPAQRRAILQNGGF